VYPSVPFNNVTTSIVRFLGYAARFSPIFFLVKVTIKRKVGTSACQYISSGRKETGKGNVCQGNGERKYSQPKCHDMKNIVIGLLHI